MEIEKWFKTKKYPHIGVPITISDYKWVKDYVEDYDKIRMHSFLPLIHKSIIKRRFRADKMSAVLNPSGKRQRKLEKPKIRDIFFSSHLDSIVLSKYNEILVGEYEKYIKHLDFNESVVAYRKIPISKGAKKNKCNIDFAKSTFEYIRTNNSKQLTAIVADVTSFFDNLNHKTLKKQWGRVLKKSSLPDDHYNIFKALTNIKYVEGEQLFQSYGNTMMVERGIPHSSNKAEYIRKKIKSSKFFKEKAATHYCDKKDFLKNNLNLVVSKNNSVGIPQGSPLSATLANIYMLDFDQKIFHEVSSVGGFYQRYSDDLVIICEQAFEDEMIKLIRDEITSLVHLKIEPNKTKIFRFEKVKGKFTGFEIDEKTKKENYNNTLAYLGFSFDGERVLIKPSGFSKFYRSMKSTFKKSASLAINSQNPDKSLFKSRLFKRFTHRGAKRKLIYRPSKTGKAVYEKTNDYYWGNYLSYIYKANDSMKTINFGDDIKRQSRKFWKRFNDLMKFHEGRLKTP